MYLISTNKLNCKVLVSTFKQYALYTHKRLEACVNDERSEEVGRQVETVAE